MSDSREYDPEDIRVGAIVRALREAHGLTAIELGRAIGKSEGLITAIERGFRHATPQVCRVLADRFRVPLAVFTFEDYEQIREAEEADPAA